MSILFRTKGWLTLAQLLPAWASELAEGKRDANKIERDLRHFLIEDIINGRFDDSGPLRDGRRLGLRFITPENRAGYLEGHQARELITADGTPAAFSFVSNRLLVLKEAVLDFARRNKLPPPSWWIDVSTATNEHTADAHVVEVPMAGEKADLSAAEQEARAADVRSRAIKLEVTARRFAESIRDLEALPSSTLRWLYGLMPRPTAFDDYGRERELAERILAERDQAEPAAPTPAPILPPSVSDGAVDLPKLSPQPAQPEKGDIRKQVKI